MPTEDEMRKMEERDAALRAASAAFPDASLWDHASAGGPYRVDGRRVLKLMDGEVPRDGDVLLCYSREGREFATTLGRWASRYARHLGTRACAHLPGGPPGGCGVRGCPNSWAHPFPLPAEAYAAPHPVRGEDDLCAKCGRRRRDHIRISGHADARYHHDFAEPRGSASAAAADRNEDDHAGKAGDGGARPLPLPGETDSAARCAGDVVAYDGRTREVTIRLSSSSFLPEGWMSDAVEIRALPKT